MSEKEAYAVAIGLLSRREHSARELRGKLHSRGFEPALVDTVLAQLEQERLLSDERFAEAYLRQRSGKGYGPERIRAELRERGIGEALITETLRRAEEEEGLDWFELARAVYRKKFRGEPSADMKETMKRQRFMQYRGFSREQIAAVIEGNNQLQ